MIHLVIYLNLVIQAFAFHNRPNFVFILTDDQDLLLKGLVPMKKTKILVANQGVTFKNAFANSPICCPSRSSILTGKYLHNSGVTNNSISGNCSSVDWQTHQEPYTIASLLKQEAGYKTFYAGKYLNQYGSKLCGGTKHIPRGYDWWIGLKGNSKYYNYTLSINGTATKFGNRYLTDLIKEYAMEFLNQHGLIRTPFFMILAPPAPHAPFTAAPRHEKRYQKMKAVRTPSFNHTSKNKHWLVTMKPDFLPENVTALDEIQRKRMQTLLAVDEMIEAVILKLEALKILNETYIIVTSDNGFHIGQFTQPWDKRQPYETDIRVPFLMRGPKMKKKTVSNYPISLVDIAPTILSAARIKVPDYMDGLSFLKAFKRKTYDKNILIEYRGEGNSRSVAEQCPWSRDPNLAECVAENWCKCQDSKNNTYSCVRKLSVQVDGKFCQFLDDQNFLEVYDLKSDPFELVNIHESISKEILDNYQQTLKKLTKCKGYSCNSIFV